MMSRALVVAGLARDMKEGRKVAIVKLRFVLEVVAGVEGQKVADEIDGAVLEYQERWRARLVGKTELVKRARGEEGERRERGRRKVLLRRVRTRGEASLARHKARQAYARVHPL